MTNSECRPKDMRLIVGSHIARELHKLEWSMTDFASVVGISVSSVSLMINGLRGVSAEMSARLGIAFGVADDFYYRMGHPGCDIIRGKDILDRAAAMRASRCPTLTHP